MDLQESLEEAVWIMRAASLNDKDSFDGKAKST